MSAAGPRSGRGRRRGPASVVPEAEFRSYYGLPVLNRPTWKPLDIAGYLFLGGLAGASSALAAAVSTGAAPPPGRVRPGLVAPLRFGAAGAIGLSLVALVHDLGRPARFYNMMRVFKPSTPMSVGSWILSVYAPAAIGTAALDVVPLPGRLGPARRPLQHAAGLVAGLAGPAVATYTGVLISDTAVPAWHGGYREMPFYFASSASSAAGGLGLLTAPVDASAPARRLGVAGAVAELAVGRVMRARMGLAAETFERGRAGRLLRAAEALTAAGAGLALAGRRSRAVSVAAGAGLLAGSALTRFGVFHAGVASAEDPRYTVQPQRESLGSRPSEPPEPC